MRKSTLNSHAGNFLDIQPVLKRIVMGSGAFITIGLLDLIDILIVAYLLYKLYSMTRGTAAMSIFVGLALLYVLWLLVRAFNMELTSTILGQIMGVGLLALIIVFQQEIRKFLLLMGTKYMSRHSPFLSRFIRSATKKSEPNHQFITELVDACAQMSYEKVGALIAIARKSDLRLFADTGVYIDAKVSSRLIENIFFKNSPLHDGALIINNGRIEAVQCILPVSDNPSIAKRLGLRHRAALGLSEQTDALIIVVSEETGIVSVVERGKIKEGLNRVQLEKALVAKI